MAFIQKHSLTLFTLSMILIAINAFLLNQTLWSYIAIGSIFLALLMHKNRAWLAKKLDFLF